MKPVTVPRQALRSIADVERETGIPRATLRIWERRYGFPQPQRDERDERCYDGDQVAQLSDMRRLIEQGHRPAKLIAAGAGEIRRLVGAALKELPARPLPARLPTWMKLLKAHDVPGLRADFESRLETQGLAAFAGTELPVMSSLVGEAWAAGDLEVHEEHLYSDCVYEVVRGAISRASRDIRPEAPQVLLTTFPQEYHGLGLLMAHAMFALQGCPTVSLGVRLPVDQIVSGVKAYKADLVGLSFTASMNPTHVQRGLEELRERLPASVRIWAGGNSPVLQRRALAGVRSVPDLRLIPALLAEDFALPPQAMA